MRIKVVVQTCPQRREHLAETLDSVRASDVGGDFEVMEHPEGMPLYHFFLSVMRRLRDSDADYGIRLEDDVIVSPYFAHNVRKWAALHEQDFGAGWLFTPQGMIEDTFKIGRSNMLRQPYRNTSEVHAALAVVLPIPLLREELYPWMAAQKHPEYPQDFAMSRSVWAAGRRCYLHLPPLVENRMLPSTRGHQDHTSYGHCAGRYFKPLYRRN